MYFGISSFVPIWFYLLLIIMLVRIDIKVVPVGGNIEYTSIFVTYMTVYKQILKVVIKQFECLIINFTKNAFNLQLD